MAEKSARLYRSKKDRILFGVCGGLAKYFDFDPILVRLLFVIATLMDGIGILAYLLILVFVPREPGELAEIDRKGKIKEMVGDIGEKAQDIAEEIKKEGKRISRRELFGLILVIVGCLVLFRTFFPYEMQWIKWGLIWPTVIIVVGFSLVFTHPKHK